jgi:hypothetical protein
VGSGGIVPLFSTTALEVDEWLASRPCRFTPQETDRGTFRQAVDTRADLEAVE